MLTGVRDAARTRVEQVPNLDWLTARVTLNRSHLGHRVLVACLLSLWETSSLTILPSLCLSHGYQAFIEIATSAPKKKYSNLEVVDP